MKEMATAIGGAVILVGAGLICFDWWVWRQVKRAAERIYL